MIYLAGVIYVVVVLFFVGKRHLSCERGPECGIGTRAQAICITLQPVQRCLRAQEREFLLLPKSCWRLDMRSKKPDITVHKEDVDYNLAVNDDQF